MNGGVFVSTSPARDADIFSVGIGLTVARSGPFKLDAAYDYSVGQTTSDNSFFVPLKAEF